MTIFGGSNDADTSFVDANLRGARFIRSDLSRVVMRAVEIQGADIDAPWVGDNGGTLLVNGVDVVPFVEAELDRRFPGRAQRHASDPAGLRAAWAVLQRTWAVTLARAAAMPSGTVDASVADEWSFAQTLRHLILATDVWLRGAVLRIDRPLHPIGQPHAEYETDGYDMTVFATSPPDYAEVLEVRADHVAQVRDFLATVTPDALAAPCRHPWAPDHQVTVLHCLHVILEEEWEHHRYAVRDLDAIESGGQPDSASASAM